MVAMKKNIFSPLYLLVVTLIFQGSEIVPMGGLFKHNQWELAREEALSAWAWPKPTVKEVADQPFKTVHNADFTLFATQPTTHLTQPNNNNKIRRFNEKEKISSIESYHDIIRLLLYYTKFAVWILERTPTYHLGHNSLFHVFPTLHENWFAELIYATTILKAPEISRIHYYYCLYLLEHFYTQKNSLSHTFIQSSEHHQAFIIKKLFTNISHEKDNLVQEVITKKPLKKNFLFFHTVMSTKIEQENNEHLILNKKCFKEARTYTVENFEEFYHFVHRELQLFSSLPGRN